MEILIFDTETTGLLKPSPAKLKTQPYIIELYACVLDENFKLLREFNSLFSVDFNLDPIITKITGLKDEDLKNQPVFIQKQKDLAKFFTGVDVMVAHNLEFDKSMLANELLRCDRLIQFPWSRHHVCTVEKSMNIRGHRLSLTNLHQELLGKQFSGAHRAKEDVHALVRCFHALIEKKYIELKDYEG